MQSQPPNGNQQFPFDRMANQPETSVIPINYTEGVPAPSPYFPYERMEPEEGVLNLRELWFRIRRRKWLILVIVSIVTLLSAVEASRQKSIYQASATIEVGNNNQMLLKTADLVIESDNSEIETALFILESYPLLEDVVANLRLDQNQAFLDITKERTFWDVINGKLGKGQDTAENQDEENQEAELIIQSNKIDRTPEESKRLAPFVGIVRGGLNVEQLKQSRLIKVSFTHTNPEIAALIANGVSEQYKKYNSAKKSKRFDDTSDWLRKSTRDLETQMQKAEQELANYTRTHGIFNTEGKEDLTATKLSHLHDQAMRAETDRLIKQSLYEEVRQGRVDRLPEAFSNLATAELQKKLSELTVAAAQLSARFGPENPKVSEVKLQVDALQKEILQTRGQLADRLQADFERAVRDEASLKSALSRAKAEAVQQNQTAIQFNILKQNVETAKALYTDFLQKTRQADVERVQQDTNNVNIAEPARVPGGPIGPLRFRAVLLAFVLSLAGSIGLVFLLDHLDNTIKTVEDVSRYVRLPALGVIPAIDTTTGRRISGRRKQALGGVQSNKQVSPAARVFSQLSSPKESSSVAEAYRMLRTSILLASAGQPPKTVLVTSSQPGEGKTTTAVNTGICLSQLGATVLLIDADLRRPRIHKIFGVNHRRGLSNYLSSNIPLRSVIQPTGIPNLYLLASGIVPPNSAELLSSEKMRYMLGKLSAHFDHILIDSPPIGSVTDPVILSRQVDGVMLIVHGGKSSREMVVHARQELANVGAKIFGVVLNNVNMQRDGYDYYYYRRYQYEYSRETPGQLGDNGQLN